MSTVSPVTLSMVPKKTVLPSLSILDSSKLRQDSSTRYDTSDASQSLVKNKKLTLGKNSIHKKSIIKYSKSILTAKKKSKYHVNRFLEQKRLYAGDIQIEADVEGNPLDHN